MILSNQQKILETLKKDIDATSRTIIILAGHLPLRYEGRETGDPKIYTDIHRWGFFSLFTFQLGAQLLRYALDWGKKGKLVVVVDDDCEIHSVPKEDKQKRDDNTFRALRRKAMATKSFPKAYQDILSEHDLDLSHLVTQKRRNKTTVLLSEKILKEQAKVHGLLAENPCSKAYKGLLLTNNYFNQDTDYLISFLPEQCKGNICTGVLDENPKLQASHIFFPDVEAMGAINKLEKGGYIESKYRKPITLEEVFNDKAIVYRKDQ